MHIEIERDKWDSKTLIQDILLFAKSRAVYPLNKSDHAQKSLDELCKRLDINIFNIDDVI